MCVCVCVRACVRVSVLRHILPVSGNVSCFVMLVFLVT